MYLLAIKGFGHVETATDPLTHLAASWNFSIAPNKRELFVCLLIETPSHSSLLGDGQVHPSSTGQCLKEERSRGQI